MSTTSFRFRPAIARRIPDPNFKQQFQAERHIFVMPVRAMPPGLPLDPNARRPNLNKRIYQDVEESLLGAKGEPGTFHLKNKGITIIAESVKQEGEEYVVELQNGSHGIVDGGHTYTLIVKNQDEAELPDNQYVTVEVRTGVPLPWIPEIAGGLNTSVQVQDMSLDHLKGLFEWVKTELVKEPYFPHIAWSENDDGEYDARDIVSLMYVFNIELFPNDSDDQPIAGYEKKSTALAAFEEKGDSFKRMRGILTDILRLHDIIGIEAVKLWNKATPHGKAGNLAFVEAKKRGQFEFYFLDKKAPQRLMSGALYPILSAFRWYVVRDKKTLNYRWRDDFDAVVEAWQRDGAELLKQTKQMNDDLGRNPNALGKSRPHWANMHNVVAKRDLMATRDSAAAK